MGAIEGYPIEGPMYLIMHGVTSQHDYASALFIVNANHNCWLVLCSLQALMCAIYFCESRAMANCTPYGVQQHLNFTIKRKHYTFTHLCTWGFVTIWYPNWLLQVCTLCAQKQHQRHQTLAFGHAKCKSMKCMPCQLGSCIFGNGERYEWVCHQQTLLPMTQRTFPSTLMQNATTSRRTSHNCDATAR